MISRSFGAAFRAIAGLFVVAAALVAAPRDAHAVHKFCATIDPVYTDSHLGEDYLRGRVSAAFHYMQVTFNGVTTSGYSDVNGCLPTTFSGAGTYLHYIFPQVKLGSSTTTVLQKQGSPLTGVVFNWANLPASTGSAVTERRTPITGTAEDYLFRVSAVVEFVPLSLTVVNTNYTIFARVPAAETICPAACVSGNNMWLSNEPSNPSLWTNQEKGVIAHEFGHFSQKDSFGFFGQQGVAAADIYCEVVNEKPCKCTFVPTSPGSGRCGNEQGDRLHCLNSREYMFGAFTEGYAHLVATMTLNDTNQGAAIFPYYKHLSNNTGSNALFPPVAHQVWPLTVHRWMDNNCAVTMSGKGTEMDWLSFLYYVRTQTPTKFSAADFQSVMIHSSVCNGACSDADKVSYAKMVQGVDGQTSWAAAKKNHFKNNASIYGVNH